MSDQQDYDCIVIGAGIQGSFTAYHLAKNNKRTLVLEQFLLPHSRGSSHGQTRIIRKAYEHEFYTHMMEECYLLWAKLEAEANVTLFRYDRKAFNYATSVKCVCPYVLCCRCQVVKINVCYWKEKVPGTYDISSRFPCFVQLGVEGSQYHFYGLPSNEYPGLMKICYHMGSETEPDERDRQTDRTDVNLLSQFVSRYLPGLEPEPAAVESCLYTVTPDHHFVLDRHPHHNNIIIGAGFSGHGFKFGPVVGKVLCELSLGQMPSYDLSPFKIQRFQSNPKSSL
ncbi:peroxisomal sarcosine oxidase-like [Salvelinus sp. IW2-2015]|uniref:peroxisomal sarcosine oxidase-like n=1 Tax=Salvelinus sp. IW2-2015 TaxID=2691554 RepID=UPI000CDF7114|nr:peroxisomal sarcosine oxidase-like [Salvelinus alpinus]